MTGPNDNLHTLHTYGTDLAVVCTRCGHRSLVPEKKIMPGGTKGLMTAISTVARRMRCTTCNIKQSHAFVPPNKQFAERWLNYEIMETPGLDEFEAPL